MPKLDFNLSKYIPAKTNLPQLTYILNPALGKVVPDPIVTIQQPLEGLIRDMRSSNNLYNRIKGTVGDVIAKTDNITYTIFGKAQSDLYQVRSGMQTGIRTLRAVRSVLPNDVKFTVPLLNKCTSLDSMISDMVLAGSVLDDAVSLLDTIENTINTTIHNLENRLFSTIDQALELAENVLQEGMQALGLVGLALAGGLVAGVIHGISAIAHKLSSAVNKELGSFRVNVKVFAFTRSQSYDLSAKLEQIRVTAIQGTLPVFTVIFSNLDKEELIALTDKRAGLTITFADQHNNVLFIVPTLMPTAVETQSQGQTRPKQVTVHYLPQWQFDMLYRTNKSLTLHVGDVLRDKVLQYANDRFIYIIDKKALSTDLVNRTVQYTNEPVVQVLKELDRMFKLYDISKYESAQVIIPYVSILPDGRSVTAILAPNEERLYVYKEVCQKRPLFVHSMPVYGNENKIVEKAIKRIYDPKLDIIFVSTAAEITGNTRQPSEALKQTMHPEYFGTTDESVGRVDFVETAKDIARYLKMSDEYTLTFGQGPVSFLEKHSRQIRELFKHLSYPKQKLPNAYASQRNILQDLAVHIARYTV